MNPSDMRLPDLSGLPPEIRQKLEKQLASMSPEMRRHFIENGLPQLLQRLVGKSTAGKVTAVAKAARGGQASAADLKHVGTEVWKQLARRIPHGHYNDTVRPGDKPGAGRGLLYFVFVAFVVSMFLR